MSFLAWKLIYQCLVGSTWKFPRGDIFKTESDGGSNCFGKHATSEMHKYIVDVGTSFPYVKYMVKKAFQLDTVQQHESSHV